MPGISKTVVSLQPGKMEEVTKFLDAQSGVVTELAGMIGFIIGLYESSQNARDASDKVQEIFAGMAPFVASPPDRGVYSGAWFPAK